MTRDRIGSQIEEDLRDYLTRTLAVFANQESSGDRSPRAREDVAEAAFQILTRREFSYLGKSKAQGYRPDTCRKLQRNVAQEVPLRFYFDIGGGYHASLDPHRLALTYQPGLGELLVLRQIKRFDDQIRTVYSLGSRFSLVIDNLCAWVVNDIPVDETLGYCEQLRRLIRNVGLDANVDVLIESEHFSPDDYPTDTSGAVLPEPSIADIENVARFLGRPCCRQEAMERIARYQVVAKASETHFDTVIRGVHMTQRATPLTFGFRPFPGADSRIQAGEVILVRGKRGKIVPRLLTSRKPVDTNIQAIEFPDLLPPPLTRISYAIPG